MTTGGDDFGRLVRTMRQGCEELARNMDLIIRRAGVAAEDAKSIDGARLVVINIPNLITVARMVSATKGMDDVRYGFHPIENKPE